MEPLAIILTTVGWLISTLINKAITALLEAWAERVGLGKEFITLKKELTNINSTLETARRLQTKNEALGKLLQDLQQLAYEADDLLDELDYYRIQDDIELYGGGHSSSSQQMTGSTGSSSSSSSSSGFKLASRRLLSAFKQGCCSSARDDVVQTQNGFQIRITISRRMNELVAKLKENNISVRKALKVETIVTIRENLENQDIITNPRETTSRMIERVFGRDKEQEELIDMIVGEEATGQNLSIVAIVGHGGVGKTTLARSVYNDKVRVKTDHFEKKMWVTVLNNFNVKRLIREILQCATGDDYKNIDNLDMLQTTLEESLQEGRFLLVLDDLWEDKDKDGWDMLLAPLKNSSKKGNVVMVTTRLPGIRNLDSTIISFSLDGLEENAYWSLFKAHTFSHEMHEEHPNLQNIGRDIVRKLKGNPLAAKTVGALLKKDLSERHWRTVLEREEWKHDDGVNSIMQALRISYDYLLPHLQRCFSYCALFPKDFKFEQKFIVNLWIAQSFIHDHDQGKRLEDVGKNYLDGLVDSGFLQRNVEEYVMHDLLHDLAQIVSSVDCLSNLDGGEIQKIPPTTRHLSILNFKNLENKLNKVKNHLNTGKLSTLLISTDYFGHSSDEDDATIEGFSDGLKHARGLRVLILVGKISCSRRSITFSLNFTHLRYLFFYSDSRTLPEEICHLYHLQVLDVRAWDNLEQLPNKFSNLINLRHFIVPEEKRNLHSSIASVGKLTNIHELYFEVRTEIEYSIEQLRELKQLRELCICNLQNVKSMEKAKGAGLLEKQFLNRLYLSWNRENSGVGHAADKDVLDGLHPHPHLRELVIIGYSGGNSVAWLNSLTNLEEVYLKACAAWEILPPLGQLPLLKRLYLINMPAVKDIGPDLYGTCRQHIPFQCLEVMKLKDLPNLAKWVWDDQYKNFPALLELSIRNCPLLDLSWSPILSSEKVTVHLNEVESFKIFSISESNLVIHKATNPKAWDVVSFQMLRTRQIIELEIKSSPYPLSWDDLFSLVYLKELRISECSVPFILPNKESYNQTRPPLITLQELNLTECGITGKQLTWVLHHMPMLSQLNLDNCHKIKSIGMATFTASHVVELNREEENLHLSELVSNDSSGLLCPSEIEQPISNACLHPPWLQKIRLVHMSELTSISLEGLTSLTKMYLSDMEKLELLDVSSCIALEDLVMVNCGRLASLKGLKSLIHLEHLVVEWLPSFVDAWIFASEEGSFRTLEYLSIDTFSFLAKPICRQLTSLLNLTINGDKDKVSMTEEQEEALLLLTSLKVIGFYSCQNLQVLPEKLHQLHSLEKLEILFCHNIQSLPENGLPKSLRSLEVRRCGPKVWKLFTEYECGPEVEKDVQY